MSGIQGKLWMLGHSMTELLTSGRGSCRTSHSDDNGGLGKATGSIPDG